MEKNIVLKLINELLTHASNGKYIGVHGVLIAHFRSNVVV